MLLIINLVFLEYLICKLIIYCVSIPHNRGDSKGVDGEDPRFILKIYNLYYYLMCKFSKT